MNRYLVGRAKYVDGRWSMITDDDVEVTASAKGLKGTCLSVKTHASRMHTRARNMKRATDGRHGRHTTVWPSLLKKSFSVILSSRVVVVGAPTPIHLSGMRSYHS